MVNRLLEILYDAEWLAWQPKNDTLRSIPEAKLKDPWKAVKDKETGQIYYWNQVTDETTDVGSPRPKHWVEVRDEETGDIYYWAPKTNETTAIGEPRPNPLNSYGGHQQQQLFLEQQPQSLGSAVKSAFMWGIGISLAFSAVRLMFG